MKSYTLPLAGPPTQRNLDPTNFKTKDQRYVGCLFTASENKLAGTRQFWVNKRPGFPIDATINAGKRGLAICDSYGFKAVDGTALNAHCTAWHDGASAPNTQTYFMNATAIGTTTTALTPKIHITKGVDASENEYFIIVISGDSAYYIGETGLAGAGVTFTGDTHTNTTIDNVSSVVGLVIGQKISGTNIVAGTRIANLVGTTITTDIATTGTTATVTITRERMAKIIDADFPVPTGPMQQLNGYYFIAQNGGRRVYQSAVNTHTSWAAADYLTVDSTAGEILGVTRSGNRIIAHKTDAIEIYYNNGNASGSILSVDEGARVLLSSLGDTSQLTSTTFRNTFDWINDMIFTVQNGVYMTINNTTKKVSNSTIEGFITTSTGVTTSGFLLNGKPYFMLNAGTAWSFLYDIELDLWSESGFSTDPIISKHLTYAILRSPDTSGMTFRFPRVGSAQTFQYSDQDGGSGNILYIQTNRDDFGVPLWKTVRWIDLIADVQSSGTTTLEQSIDDGANWTTLGTFDMTLQQKRIYRGSTYKGQAQYRLTHSANTPFRASALKFAYDAGTF